MNKEFWKKWAALIIAGIGFLVVVLICVFYPHRLNFYVDIIWIFSAAILIMSTLWDSSRFRDWLSDVSKKYLYKKGNWKQDIWQSARPAVSSIPDKKLLPTMVGCGYYFTFNYPSGKEWDGYVEEIHENKSFLVCFFTAIGRPYYGWVKEIEDNKVPECFLERECENEVGPPPDRLMYLREKTAQSCLMGLSRAIGHVEQEIKEIHVLEIKLRERETAK